MLRKPFTVLALAAALLGSVATTFPTQDARAASSEAVAGAPGYLEMPELVVPVAARGRLSGYVVIKATVEFENGSSARSVEPWTPRIVDAWLRTVNGLSQRGHFDAATVDPDMLKRQLLEATRQALHQDAAHEVLLSQALFTRVN